MQVEQNRYYLTSNGDVIGPTWEYSEGGFYAIDGYQVVWDEFGIPNCPESPRLVACANPTDGGRENGDDTQLADHLQTCRRV